MSKGIIVVDKIPRNCRNIRGDTENGCPYGGMVCQIAHKDVMRHVQNGTKPDWCPIRPLLKKIGHAAISDADYMFGWNACIDEILKDGDTRNP